MISATKEDVRIDGDEGVWDINMTAPIGGLYLGTFRFRCILNPLQTIQADRDYRKLIGADAFKADVRADNLAFSLSQLKQRVISSPPFWNPNNLDFGGGMVKDLEVIDAVFTAAVEAERLYRQSMAERHEKAVENLKKKLDEDKANRETDEFFEEDEKAKPAKRGKSKK